MGVTPGTKQDTLFWLQYDAISLLTGPSPLSDSLVTTSAGEPSLSAAAEASVFDNTFMARSYSWISTIGFA